MVRLNRLQDMAGRRLMGLVVLVPRVVLLYKLNWRRKSVETLQSAAMLWFRSHSDGRYSEAGKILEVVAGAFGHMDAGYLVLDSFAGSARTEGDSTKHGGGTNETEGNAKKPQSRHLDASSKP